MLPEDFNLNNCHMVTTTPSAWWSFWTLCCSCWSLWARRSSTGQCAPTPYPLRRKRGPETPPSRAAWPPLFCRTSCAGSLSACWVCWPPQELPFLTRSTWLWPSSCCPSTLHWTPSSTPSTCWWRNAWRHRRCTYWNVRRAEWRSAEGFTSCQQIHGHRTDQNVVRCASTH